MPKVLHATASGYFPSCLTENSALATQSLEVAMTIYWRVKSWTITISGDQPVPAKTFTQTAPDETYLVCDNSGDDGNGFSPNDENGFFFLTGFFVNSYASPTLYGVIPAFSVISDTGKQYNSGGFTDFEREVGTFSLLGKSYPLYRISEDDPEPAAASGVIADSGYWPFSD